MKKEVEIKTNLAKMELRENKDIGGIENLNYKLKMFEAVKYCK